MPLEVTLMWAVWNKQRAAAFVTSGAVLLAACGGGDTPTRSSFASGLVTGVDAIHILSANLSQSWPYWAWGRDAFRALIRRNGDLAGVLGLADGFMARWFARAHSDAPVDAWWTGRGREMNNAEVPDLRFLHYDVFTNRRFEGNQLAVFPDARGIDASTMQALAREMNFSESTFIVPAERADTDIRMRIFTPGSELPMAGHPTIGSTFALAHEGVIAPNLQRFVFGLGVGPTPVELRWNDRELAFAWMDQRPPEIRPAAASAEELTHAVGVEHTAFAATRLPVEEISCGVPFIFVPLASRAAVDSALPDAASMRRVRSAFGGNHIAVFLFSVEGATEDVTAYSRMFAPGLGVFEDPATGGASGPLGCYLLRHGLVSRADAGKIVSLQGVAMGRPSRIHIAITSDEHGTITRVQVGGQAVLVGEGRLTV